MTADYAECRVLSSACARPLDLDAKNVAPVDGDRRCGNTLVVKGFATQFSARSLARWVGAVIAASWVHGSAG